MLDEQKCRAAGQQEFLKLDTGEHIYVIHRFVPDMKMCAFTEACRQQHLFLLPGAVVSHILFKLCPRKIQLAQDGLEQALVDFPPARKVCQITAQKACVLRP